jgi:long-subunit acyl-CoA synthetase (AMP-forming)
MAKSDIESVQFFWSLGIMVHEIYGSTECNLITANTLRKSKLETSGQPLLRAKVMIGALSSH